jgi:hypothetical protein
MTPAELFHRAGRALFGEQYVAPMAVLLGVEKNTVGKWRDGKSRSAKRLERDRDAAAQPGAHRLQGTGGEGDRARPRDGPIRDFVKPPELPE